nr:hypothetical protein [Tanacetum cinerariifolium]
MMKGSDIGIHEKKAKLFNEWERFNSNERESIEFYYHRFLKLMNDLKRNKHFPKKIARNLKFLNNLQPEWKGDITDPTTAMNMALALMAKAFKLNYSTPTNNYLRISSNLRNRQIAQPGNLNGYNVVQNVRNQVAQNLRVQNIRCYNCRRVGHYARNYTIRPKRGDAAYLQTQLLIAQKEEAGIQLQAKKYDLMAAAADLDEIEKVNANCILMANLQQASTSGTQTDSASVYDSDRSAEHRCLQEDREEWFEWLDYQLQSA